MTATGGPAFTTTMRMVNRVHGHTTNGSVHHRVPTYAKGKVGRIERVCGLHGEPEKFIRGDGNPAQRLYRVRIPQVDLWDDYAGTDGDDLEIEIFEHWLEELNE